MMGGRLIKYFGVGGTGRLDASILFSIIGYRLPEFLITLILPLGFIGLMLWCLVVYMLTMKWPY